MAGREELLETVAKHFGQYERPELFVNRMHCCECEEHYIELVDVPVEAISYKDVENAGWDPTCFLTPDAFKYYLPGLARIADQHPEDFLESLAMRLVIHYTETFTREDRAALLPLLEAWALRDDIDDWTRHPVMHAYEVFEAALNG